MEDEVYFRCNKCTNVFNANCWWDESGYGYSTKFTKCPYCGQIMIVKVVEDIGLDVNNDERFYEYN